MNKSAEEIRHDVRNDYAKRIAAPSGCGCGCGSNAIHESHATLAGYSEEELASVPSGMASSSFACGNPLAYAGVKSGDVVLDLGSGAGLDLILAAQKIGPSGRVIGVDMTDAMLDRARGNITSANMTNVEVRKGLIEELPVADNSVDWVISNCVINLSPEKQKVFREIVRVLKPRGRMLVSDIVAHDLPAALLENPALYSSCVAGAISEERYLMGLREAGLTDVKVLDRLVYDAGQIAGFAEAALGYDRSRNPEIVTRISSYADELEGKIWSAKISGRKPA